MNGLNLFQGESIAVTNDAFGQTYSFNTTDLTATNYAEAVDTEVFVTPNPDDENSPSHVLTSIGAKWAITKIRTALEQLSTDRASSGSVMGRLHRINDQLGLLRENLDQTVSRIRDTNVAAESTRFARHQILMNSSTEMLKQANILPQHALRLILGL